MTRKIGSELCFFAFLALIAGFMLGPGSDKSSAQNGSPCQWTYTWVAGVATASYCGNVTNGQVPTLQVSSNAALTSLPVSSLSAGAIAYKLGNVTPNDGGSAQYYLTKSACTLNSGSGDSGSQFPAAGGNACWNLVPQFPYPVTLWGADTTYTNASDTAFNNWWSFCNALLNSSASGKSCYIPPGHYKFASSQTWNFYNNQNGGVNISGPGASALLDFSGTAGNGLLIDCYTGSTGCGAFFGVFSGFNVQANITNGNACQLGLANFSDAFNTFQFSNIQCKNLAAAAGSAGLSINYVVDAQYTNVLGNDNCADAYGNCPSGGDGIQLRQAQFSTFQGGGGGSAKNPLHLTAGANFGNTFNAVDTEASWNGLVIDSASSQENNFVNGTYVVCTAANTQCDGGAGTGVALSASAGAGNIIDNPQFGYNTGVVTGTAATMVGLEIRGSNWGVSTPGSFPSATAVQNLTGHKVYAVINGGTISQECFGPSTGVCYTTTSSFPVLLNPLDNLKITYTGQPNITWLQAE